ncbi:MAG: hypothetical protein R2742_05830 [Micropruina glycogenica]
MQERRSALVSAAVTGRIDPHTGEEPMAEKVLGVGMTSAMKEFTFESEICEYLEAHGWLYSSDDTSYDRELALFPVDVFGWLEESQPAEWAKVVRPDGGDEQRAKAKARILKALAGRLDQPMVSGGGTLNVLRKGFQEVSARFQMVQPQPAGQTRP